MAYNEQLFRIYQEKVDKVHHELYEGNGNSMKTLVSKNTDFRERIEKLTDALWAKVVGFMIAQSAFVYLAVRLAEHK